MLVPVAALLHHAVEDETYLQYMGEPRKYWADRKAEDDFHDRLLALLDDPAKQLLDSFLAKRASADLLETKATFTAGLVLGLQLMKLL